MVSFRYQVHDGTEIKKAGESSAVYLSNSFLFPHENVQVRGGTLRSIPYNLGFQHGWQRKRPTKSQILFPHCLTSLDPTVRR